MVNIIRAFSDFITAHPNFSVFILIVSLLVADEFLEMLARVLKRKNG